MARSVGVPAIPDARTYSLSSPNSGAEAQIERAPRRRSRRTCRSTGRISRSSTAIRGALETLDRVATVATYVPTVTYPNNGFALALRTVAGAMVRGIGTKVFWVQTGGFDTHAGQGVAGGARTPT